MNAELTLAFWARFFGILTVEIALAALLAAGVQRWIKPARWRRTIWQIAIVGMMFVLAGQLTGVNGVVAGWGRVRKTTAPYHPPRTNLKVTSLASVKIISTDLAQL